jgi:hypothetical protein
VSIADLIAELQKYPPHKEVRVRIDSFVVDTEVGETVVVGPAYAVAADAVIYEGSHVSIEAS